MTTMLRLFGLQDVGRVDVGVEIEMEGTNLPRDLDHLGWDTKNDGSLRGESAEYVLAVPMKLVDAKTAVTDIYSKFANRNNRCRINPSDRCGVHIHINCQRDTIEQVMKFATLYLLLENLLVRWCGDDREGNLFCLRTCDAEALITVLLHDKRIGRLRGVLSDRYRYASINFTSLQKFGSVEFRALNTPDNAQRIIDWMDMLMRIKQYALNTESSSDLVMQCSARGVKNYVSEIFGEELTRKLICPDMEELVMDGVRSIQALAFTTFPFDGKDAF
jgi:hypothetical protein